MISQSTRASPGGLAALLMRITRPSTLVVVPSSSAQTLPGSTMSASCGALGQEEVDHDVEFERVERLADGAAGRAGRPSGWSRC